MRQLPSEHRPGIRIGGIADAGQGQKQVSRFMPKNRQRRVSGRCARGHQAERVNRVLRRWAEVENGLHALARAILRAGIHRRVAIAGAIIAYGNLQSDGPGRSRQSDGVVDH